MVGSRLPAEVQQDVEVLREWLKKQPHLPDNLDDRTLRRFLHSCYYSLEKTKRCMELFFSIRAASPELLTRRDPLAPDMKKAMSIVNVAFLPYSKNSNLLIYQLNDPGMDQYDYVKDARLYFVASDVWLLNDDKLEDEDIIIIDAKDVSMKFLTKFNIAVAKKLGQYQQEASPIRITSIHVVNAPSFIDKIFSLMKPFIKQEYCDMIRFHLPNSDTLYKYVNRDELPEDYGGRAGTMAGHMQATVEAIMAKRDFLLDDKVWKADERLRPRDNKFADPGLQMSGSFRALAID